LRGHTNDNIKESWWKKMFGENYLFGCEIISMGISWSQVNKGKFTMCNSLSIVVQCVNSMWMLWDISQT